MPPSVPAQEPAAPAQGAPAVPPAPGPGLAPPAAPLTIEAPQGRPAPQPPMPGRRLPAWVVRALAFDALAILFLGLFGAATGIGLGLLEAMDARVLAWFLLAVPPLAGLLLLDAVWTRYLHGDHVRLRMGQPARPWDALPRTAIADLRRSMVEQDGAAVAAHFDGILARSAPTRMGAQALALAPARPDGPADGLLALVPWAWACTLALWGVAASALSTGDPAPELALAVAATLLCATGTWARLRTRWRRARLDAWITWYAIHAGASEPGAVVVPRVTAAAASPGPAAP